MNRITEARVELFEALSSVLPGRVAATPPVGKPYVAPYIWIGQPGLGWESTGQRTQLTSASFPIWVSYDGAVPAQVAGNEDVVAKVWDAVLSVPAARPVAASPQTVDVAGTLVAGTVVTVAVTLGAFTLCLPTVEESPIPPEPVLEEV